MPKWICAVVVLVALGAGRALALTTQEEKALRPEDLGAETIDVTAYPPEHQKSYPLFLSKCSACHTPARAIQSKLVTHEEWTHFVSLMHGRFLSRSMGPVWKVDEGRRIIEFLTYDSTVRKVNRQAAFNEERRKLLVRFDEIQREKAERAKRQPTQPSAPYTGANP